VNKKQRKAAEKGRRHSMPVAPVVPFRRHLDGVVPSVGIPSRYDDGGVVIPSELIGRHGPGDRSFRLYGFMAALWQTWADGQCPVRDRDIRQQYEQAGLGGLDRALDGLFAKGLIVSATDAAGETVYLPSPDRPELIASDDVRDAMYAERGGR
jgi:hypothetical protein